MNNNNLTKDNYDMAFDLSNSLILLSKLFNTVPNVFTFLLRVNQGRLPTRGREGGPGKRLRLWMKNLTRITTASTTNAISVVVFMFVSCIIIVGVVVMVALCLSTAFCSLTLIKIKF